MKNRLFTTTLLTAVGLVLGSCERPAPPAPAQPPFSVVEASIPEMQKAMAEGRVTSEEIVKQYLIRIATYENVINAAIAVNPRALEQARALDAERKAGKLRGPLHGIPVALKDNIQDTDMPTTGGTIGLAGWTPQWDAPLTANLKANGAIIIAKTTLSEFAGYFGQGAPGTYSSISGYSFNPYDPRRDPRAGQNDGRGVLNTGGSSSGTGTAANFWAGNVGTETGGSIIGPSNLNMLAAIKPTIGRISRWGIIPITADQDSAGPMGKNVTDVAIMLGALEGKQADPNDPATTRCTPPANNDYTPHLKADALKGARIGVPRQGYGVEITPPGEKNPRGGMPEDQRKAYDEAIAVLKQAGAEIVDPADFPSAITKEPMRNVLIAGECDREVTPTCMSVMNYGMHRDFNVWLAAQNGTAPWKTIDEFVAWNEANKNLGTLKYGQDALTDAVNTHLEKDKAKYEEDQKRALDMGGSNGIDAVLAEHKLDAVLFMGSRGTGITNRVGYPEVTVPFAMVANAAGPPLPEGFNAKPMPMGITFTGTACTEPRLIELAYAFEQLTKRRQPPPNMP
jgi:amidase